MPSPVEIIAEALRWSFTGAKPGEPRFPHDALAVIKALEAAGKRIVDLEPTGEMIQAMYASARRRRGHKSFDLQAALAAAPTWGDKP